MDGNKDEALRCVRIAEEAISSGNKVRALKFIKIAQRLNSNLSVDELIAACDKIDFSGSNSNPSSLGVKSVDDEDKNRSPSWGLNGERNYTEENVELIKQVKRNKDYYSILGVEKSCSAEEIRKAYRKLSLKVHPDKNKAPGSEEAFKKVCKAFKCLSDDTSRKQYDQTGLVDDFEYSQQYNVRRTTRRRRNVQEFYDDDFDPDEIFRSFFGQTEMFRAHHVYRSRNGGRQREEFTGGGGPNLLLLLQILPFLLIFVLAYLPFSEPNYSLQRNFSYQISKTTEKYGIEFFVKSTTFDDNFPIGSSERANIEDSVIKDYKNFLWRHCHAELQRRQWNRNHPIPSCDKLRNLGLA
ncbi:chaperone protein dnaJ 49 [Euphorbia lathyris]|uniref:chaperone protein dnaJ 49 n=1 Tax=Euphorbia lathyris TaxID=212925 RepID=UPI0033144134